MNRYPDMGSAALYAALAERLGVPVEHLSVATGSVGLIYQLVQAFCEPGDEVVFAWRSFEAYPIAVTAAAADVGAGAGAGRRAPRPRRDGRGDHRPHQGGPGLHAQQPDRPGGDPGRARRLPRRRCPPHVLVVVDEAYVEFVRMDDAVDGIATYRAPRQRRADPHLLQGLRAGRLPGRVRRRAGPDRRRAARGLAAVRRLERRPGGGDRLAASARPSCSSGSTRWSPSATGWWPGSRAAGLGRPRARRATSSGSSSATAPADFAAAADELGIVVRPFAGEGARVSIGEAEANDRLLTARGRRSTLSGRPGPPARRSPRTGRCGPTRQVRPKTRRRCPAAPAARLTTASGGSPSVAEARTTRAPCGASAGRPRRGRSSATASRRAPPRCRRPSQAPDPRRADSKSTSLPAVWPTRQGQRPGPRAGPGPGRPTISVEGLGVDHRQQRGGGAGRQRQPTAPTPVIMPAAPRAAGPPAGADQTLRPTTPRGDDQRGGVQPGTTSSDDGGGVERLGRRRPVQPLDRRVDLVRSSWGRGPASTGTPATASCRAP